MLDVMETKDRWAVREKLAVYKEKGIINYEKTLMVPSSQRIQGLILLKDGVQRVSAALSASIQSAMSKINLRVALTADQVIDISEEIIEQSAEDNLALEDVLLFLGELVSGKAGKIYDRMDIPTFFELFETYRQKRYEALQRHKYEQEVNYKGSGDNHRTSEEIDQGSIDVRNVMKDYMKKQWEQNPKQ